MTLDDSPAGLASLYADVGGQLGAGRCPADAFDAVARVAVERVSGTEWASITQGRDGRFDTAAATDDRARAVDGIQYELGSGPCVDAVLRDAVFWTDDLSGDDRWPEFARRAVREHGVRSMMSYRLFVENDHVIAGLNLYSTRPAAFDRDAHLTGIIIAAHGALAIGTVAARQQVEQLERALVTNRDIGTAMGILMSRHKVTRPQAFALLRVASQDSNRKINDLALEVIETGALNLLPHRDRAP
jgi:GAF domain-containing protein